MIQTIETHDTEKDTIEMSSSEVSDPSVVTSKPKRNPDMKPKTPLIALILVVAIISGVGTGFGLHKLNAKGGSIMSSNESAGAVKEQSPTTGIKVGDVYGSPKEDTFKDSAEGVLQSGGIEGEGTHRILRPGGISQTVYLTSSVTDLDKFIGAKVKVWGETNTALKAGWLMDVGRIQVQQLNAEIPEEDKPTSTPIPKPTATPKGSAKKASPTSSDAAGD